MCMVSMIMDWGIDKFKPYVPPWNPYVQDPPNYKPFSPTDLKLKEIAKDVSELLKIARKYDKDNNQPDCELDEKKQLLRDLAEKLNIKITLEEEDPQGEG